MKIAWGVLTCVSNVTSSGGYYGLRTACLRSCLMRMSCRRLPQLTTKLSLAGRRHMRLDKSWYGLATMCTSLDDGALAQPPFDVVVTHRRQLDRSHVEQTE